MIWPVNICNENEFGSCDTSPCIFVSVSSTAQVYTLFGRFANFVSRSSEDRRWGAPVPCMSVMRRHADWQSQMDCSACSVAASHMHRASGPPPGHLEVDHGIAGQGGACKDIWSDPVIVYGGRAVPLQGLSFELLWHAIFGEPYVSMAVSKCDMYICRSPPPLPPSPRSPLLHSESARIYYDFERRRSARLGLSTAARSLPPRFGGCNVGRLSTICMSRLHVLRHMPLSGLRAAPPLASCAGYRRVVWIRV